MSDLIYAEPRKYSRDEAALIFASGDIDAISSLMVGLAYHDEDRQWVQERCLVFSSHDDPQLRYIAALCVAHLARIHGELDISTARPMLLRLEEDSESFVSEMAEDAIWDIQQYIGIDLHDPTAFN